IFPSLELFSAGMRFGAAASDAAVQEFHDDQGETGALPRVLRNLGDTAWTQAPLHTAVAADIDGDGVDEVVALYEAGQSLYFRPIRQIEQGEQQTEILAANLRAQSATLAAGDFDGDGKDELALGIVLSNRAEIRFFDDGDTSFVPLPELTKELPRGASSTELSFQLAAGNLDYDAADEIVAVANQVQDWNSGAATATYTIWDDGATGAAELASDILVVRDGTLHSALAAGVDIVDMDFDGVGEVVLAGVTTPQVTTALEYVAVTLDDAAHGLAPLASRVILDSEAGKDRSDNPAYYRHMWVKGLDIDGDLVPEVLVNRHVLSSLTPAPSGGGSAWPTRFILPLQHFQPDSDFDMRRDNSAIAVGDFNGDRRDDVAFLNPARDNLYIYGIAGAASAPVVIADRSVTGVGERTTPLLVPVNVDRDTAMIQYSEGESQLLFSEPVVIAAIAAPPCAEGIGQDTDACTTSYGSAESVGNGVDKSVTVSASVSVGVSFEERVFTQSQIELAATATFATTNTESTSASVEKSVTYTTGAMQDAVVFTTIPYDSYVYEIVSHSEPALVGETITINAPRQPLTLMVERSFYNERVAPGALRIDDGVFGHTVGAPSSYLKSADVLAMSGVLQSPSRSVTQTGSVEVGLNVGTENTQSSALALGFEMSLTLTAGGVMAGFSVGAEVERNLSVTHGKSTSYAGSIGAIDSEHFADNLYTFGLFTYKHRAANGQEFEVINYWVD
ncbi:MAG TPA: VCBS repeat-containing protein, partial [Polyangiaceae bacterium]